MEVTSENNLMHMSLFTLVLVTEDVLTFYFETIVMGRNEVTF